MLLRMVAKLQHSPSSGSCKNNLLLTFNSVVPFLEEDVLVRVESCLFFVGNFDTRLVCTVREGGLDCRSGPGRWRSLVHGEIGRNRNTGQAYHCKGHYTDFCWHGLDSV